MPSWRGNPNNPVPNPVQESIARGEKRTEQNRSVPVRRDTDKQKDQRITLMDVDQVIFSHLEKMQITVVDEGNIIRVPIFYGSPEKWVAARRDGFIRDRQGKIQLPAMIFRRTNSENDDDIEIFNRYVRYPVIQKNSHKNKYTQFSLLTGKNAPVNEVYHITMADHMVFTYSFIVWTEYHEQMNPIIEKIKFNTKDYWGDPRGFRFRVRAEGFTHSTELNADDDRIVRTEFNLITNGYILPETYQLLDRQYPTTEKLFTPKKIIIGTEVVGTDFDWTKVNDNSEKWRSKTYPNLKAGDEPLPPGITWGDTKDSSGVPQSVRSIVSGLKVSTTASGWELTSISQTDIQWQPAPQSPDSPGSEGWMAYDTNYFYIYSQGSWRRIPINNFV
ncbi:MAG TPA: hypothetical protein P5523_08400 [Bacteroidales bacterium]|nr:hypothetical protein [Bacteroidales bacterium]